VAEWLTHSPETLEVTGSHPSLGYISEINFSNRWSPKQRHLKWSVWDCIHCSVGRQNKRISSEGCSQGRYTNAIFNFLFNVLIVGYNSTWLIDVSTNGNGQRVSQRKRKIVQTNKPVNRPRLYYSLIEAVLSQLLTLSHFNQIRRLIHRPLVIQLALLVG